MTDDDTPRAALDGAALGAQAGERAGVPAEYLGGFLELLAAASATGRQPDAGELAERRAAGSQAAQQGEPLRGLLMLHLVAGELAWARLPGIADAPSPTAARTSGSAALSGLRSALLAVCEGFEEAGAQAVAREASGRRALLEDLLYGRGEEGELAARAEEFGLRLAGEHLVAVARAPRAFHDHDPEVRALEGELVARFGARNVLVACQEGALVCVTPASLSAATGQFTHRVRTMLEGSTGWRIGLGRAHRGPSGVGRSFAEAHDAIGFADRMELPGRVVNAAELLVFPVLLRDRAAITDLVTTVLGPLREARGGAAPLLETLHAFFACHGNNTAVARRLHVSVRTVTYRLERVRRLTGYTPTDATQRFTLETAVVGARLLGWPEEW